MIEKPMGNYPPSSGLNPENAEAVIRDRREIIELLSAANTPQEIQAALNKLFNSEVTDMNGNKVGEQKLREAKEHFINSSKRDLKSWGVEE